jgi:hypothetical protein
VYAKGDDVTNRLGAATVQLRRCVAELCRQHVPRYLCSRQPIQLSLHQVLSSRLNGSRSWRSRHRVHRLQLLLQAAQLAAERGNHLFGGVGSASLLPCGAFSGLHSYRGVVQRRVVVQRVSGMTCCVERGVA